MARNREAERRATALMRAAVLAWYSDAWPPACACCGTTEDLAIDHVHGDGPEQRAAALGEPARGGYNPGRLYRWIIEHGFPEGFQTLCKPCNSSKSTGGGCRLDHADREGQRRRGNAAAQAAWRATHQKGRHTSVRPGTVGGRILAYLAERGSGQTGAIAADLGVPYGSAAVTLSRLLAEKHIERAAHGVYCLPGQGGEVMRRMRVYEPGPEGWAAHGGRDWAAGTTWTTERTNRPIL